MKWWSDLNTLARAGRFLVRWRAAMLVPAAFALFGAGLWLYPTAMLLVALGPPLLGLRYKALEKRVRPRFGRFIREDGNEVPVVFYPHPEDPDVFCAYFAGDESPVEPEPGAKLVWDDIRNGQSIAFGVPRQDPE